MPKKFSGLYLVILLLAGFIVISRPASAALSCTSTATNVNFGAIDVSQNITFDTTSTVTSVCTGGTAAGNVLMCIRFGDGGGGFDPSGTPRYMKKGASALNFNLYSDTGRTTRWGNGGVLGTIGQFNIILNGAGSGSGTKTVYGRVSAGQQTAPDGNYSSAFSAAHVLANYGYTSQGDCTGGLPFAVGEPTFNVLATNTTTCTVSATTHNFGTVTSLASNVDGTSTVTATCSSTTPYNILLGVGTGTGATVAARKMTSGANTITYSLYSNVARSTVWGNNIGTNTVSANGTGFGQPYTVYGRVPTQSTPPPGTYTDTVVVTVNF
jgi:spore coat protein U-like protein